MSSVVQLNINNQNRYVSVKEYKGQRVVTLKDVDELHGRPEGTARRNFNNNKKHFVEGEDFFFVRKTYKAAKGFGTIAPNGLTLLTESGYLTLVKSFTDDLAWQVQRQLVNNYFRAKSIAAPRLDNTVNEMVKQALPQVIDEMRTIFFKEFTDQLIKSLREMTSSKPVLIDRPAMNVIDVIQEEGPKNLEDMLSDLSTMNLTGPQYRIVHYILKVTYDRRRTWLPISARELAKTLDMSLAATKRNLAILLDKKILIRKPGSGKGSKPSSYGYRGRVRQK